MSSNALATKILEAKTSTNRISGHCKIGVAEVLPDGRLRHPTCPGSGVYGVTTWFCACPCHVEVPICRDCRQIDVELTLDGVCVDTEGCDGAIVRKQAANPVWQMLKQLRAESEEREAREAQERAEQRRIKREQAELEAAATGRPLPVRLVRTPKPPPTPQRCHCGCGGTTKGGKFLAGHDAKLKGMLVKAARGGKSTPAIRAMAELIARDWPRKGVDTKVTEKSEALVDQHGPDRIIDLAVAKRYE